MTTMPVPPPLTESRFHHEYLAAVKAASGLTWEQISRRAGYHPPTGRLRASADRLRRAARRGGHLPHEVVVALAALFGVKANRFWTFRPEPPLAGAAAGYTLFTHLHHHDPAAGDDVMACLARLYPDLVARAVPEWHPPGRDVA